MNATYCKLCAKQVSDFLSHLYLNHGIKDEEVYKEQIKLKDENDRKEEEYHQRIRDLVVMRESKEISVEEYKLRIVKIKKE